MREYLRVLIFSFLLSWAVLSIYYWYITVKSASVFLPKQEPSSLQGSFGCEETDLEEGLYIPSLGIKARILYLLDDQKPDYLDYLSKGVVHYPFSALPGEEGQSVLLGHSAGPGFKTKNPYLKIFSNLNDLEKGEKIIVVREGCKLEYSVIFKRVYEQGQEIGNFGKDKASLVLVSCWPPGRNIMRLAVFAQPSS